MKIAFPFTYTYTSRVIFLTCTQRAKSDATFLNGIWDLAANDPDCLNDNFKYGIQVINICRRRDLSVYLQVWSCPPSGAA